MTVDEVLKAKRAEIVLFLLTHHVGHPRRVARQINHAQPPVARAMAEMAQAGFLTEHRKAREVEYSLEQTAWRRFLDVPDGLRWAQWGLVFRALRSIWGRLQAMRGRPLPPPVLGSELATCAKEVNTLLHESELGTVFAAPVPGRPEHYTAVFEEGLREMFRRMTPNSLNVLSGITQRPD
ncbi:MAG: hypothetical protein FJX73_12415 [Armatimonadetes bacterium]|nr:hypothetical protein [Armatimonadota bacterium]